ncbi:RNA polymerase sigma factor, sigma-70 family [Alkalibacterium putridalgicola]|uniref:DNA-directed RNA polymerase sigma-70 factor n=2 Tax=Alkalibacterium putridalgicola TaxID=426703 RepID=A0A1H7V0U1_9LACT|nr:DNA-directed RNA polymerase sigma-70 factor [Alkalibacterium putridalgicola]SEM02756.1 RNA polymerase sigma factor, sigma-70 family [Alkalibacterium putridalgicola]
MKMQEKTRELTDEMAADFFFVHDAIVYGALKKCQIPYNHPDYEDYVQMGRMKLVEAYEIFPKDMTEEEAFYQFTGYAFQKVKWGVLDEIRIMVRRAEREMPMPEDFEPMVVVDKSGVDEDVLMRDVYQSMLACLTEVEQTYLNDAVIHQLSVTDIAKKRDVSRKTVYAWRQRVAEKLAQYKTVLKN